LVIALLAFDVDVFRSETHGELDLRPSLPAAGLLRDIVDPFYVVAQSFMDMCNWRIEDNDFGGLPERVRCQFRLHDRLHE
jgi:hypothetical protein